MVYPVSCTAVYSYVKSWGGPSNFLGGPDPPTPSGYALENGTKFGSLMEWALLYITTEIGEL